ncbi:MAG TPA: hypothetical protein VKA09_04765 [Nitrososphaeraceae archaeon]|nr:hypothetical protein [Nitrososphaeraceae archaeon]
MATTECKTIDIVKQGLDFIISHFKAPIWPRTISTSATNGAQVLELDAQGHSIMEIAKILHISHGTVDNDLLYLRKQAQENLQKHIQERIPEEYQKAVVGINKVLKTCWNIINKDTTDDKTKL